MIGKLNHIAIIVGDLEAAIERFHQLFGARLLEREFLDESQTDVAVLDLNGVHVELLSSPDETSRVGRILRERGEGVHHLSFHTDHIEAELERLHRKGVRLLDERPRRGLHGRKIAFLDPTSTDGVLIELVQEPESDHQ
ncbi:MAG: methylmalonyl-CoA epimerase [Acidobacteria bacterium]|nr:MAG: methylmalonyl-CoA epimerase [Acidobacteriota bacterium]